MDVESIRAVIKKYKDQAEYSGPVSQELVLQAEKRLDIHFPESFRLFLLEFGCVDMDTLTFYGLSGHCALEEEPLIMATEPLREKWFLPKHILPVYEDDYVFALDLSRISDNEAPVITWLAGVHPEEQEEHGGLEVIAQTYADFFCQEVEAKLGWEGRDRGTRNSYPES